MLPSLFDIAFRLDQYERTVLPAVNHIHFIGLCIAEYKEITSEKIHLYAGISRIHRLEAKLFGPDDPDLSVIGSRFFISEEFLFEIAALLVFGDQFVFIFPELAFDDLFYQVNGYIHVVTFFFRADDPALYRDGNFDFLAFSLNA